MSRFEHTNHDFYSAPVPLSKAGRLTGMLMNLDQMMYCICILVLNVMKYKVYTSAYIYYESLNSYKT